MTSTGAARSGRREAAAGGENAARSWLFLSSAYLALQAYLWFVVPTRNTIPIAIGAALILLVIVGDPVRRRESASGIGLGLRHFAGAGRLLLLPTVVAIAVLFAVAALTPDLPRQGRFVRRFVQILPWALLQQSLLQATFNRRLQQLMGPGVPSSVVNGLFFAGMHLPGPLLTAITFVAGSFWSWTYQKRANLLALVLSHALVSAAAQSLLPAAWTHGFRVGPGYFRWR